MNATKTKASSRKTPASPPATEQPKRRGRPPGSGKASAAAEAVAATKTAGVWQMIPVASITPSPSNPRKHFDQESLADLAVSIGSKGVLQPILVRPFQRYVVKTYQGMVWKDPQTRIINYGWYVFDKFNATIGNGVARECDTEAEAELACAGLNVQAAAGGQQPEFELVAGERRWRAAKIAGLEHMPCIVRELSDVDVLEVQVVENEQRDDVSPLEKAEGYAALVEQHGVSVDDLAVRVGKSTSTIRELLKLRRLPEQARAALEAGTLPASTAGLIARVPSQFHRERVALCVVAGEDWYNPHQFNDPKVEVNKKGFNGNRDAPLSFRDTKALIERCCMVELKGAPFSRHKSGLVEGVVSCEMCPKRVGNLKREEPAAYAGVRADICTDPSCYRLKCEAHAAARLDQARDAGTSLLTPAEADQAFDSYPPYHLKYNASYIELDAPCGYLERTKSWRKALGKAADEYLVIGVDPEGIVHELLHKDHAHALLHTQHGITVAREAHGGGDDGFKKQQVAARAKAKVGAAAADCALTLIASDMEAASRSDVGGDGLKLFRAVIIALTEESSSDACRLVAKRRGLKPADKRQSQGAPLCAEIKDMDWHQLLGLTAELVAARKLLWWKNPNFSGGDSKDPLLSAFGFSYKDMLKRAKELRGDAGDD